MRGIFRRPNKQPDEQPLTPAISPVDVEALLPRSVRQPEKERFTPLAAELPEMDGDEDDEDIEFLESLVQSVEQQAPPPPRLAPRVRQERPDDAPMRVFRAMQRERDAIDRAPLNAHVPAVDLDDLLEELSTTAAALRRKAA